ncbi:MAG: iron complex outermembrane recepter [Desulfobulbaceae bacterium]|nr:MAG: iron complex outermembrane recepter [Desulfobulbaceae bacterium]
MINGSKRIGRKIILFRLWFVIHGLLLMTFLAGTTSAGDDKGNPEGVALNEVVVTAEKIEEYVKNHPQDIKVVQRQEIVERNLSSMEEILKTMPGVEVYSSSGIGSRISIRGSGRSSGVLVLLNGRPLNSNQYGSQDLSSIPVDLIESVSLFKPPVPVWLGPGGSDGAINIVTRSQEMKKDTQKISSNAKVGGGSYGLAEGSLSQQLPLVDGNALVSATAKHRDGKRENSDRTDGSLAMNWNRTTSTGSSFDLNGRYYQAEFGSPGPTDNLTPEARQDYRKFSVDTKYKGMFGEIGSLDATLYSDFLSLDDHSQSGFLSTLDDRKVGMKADTTWTEDGGGADLRVGVLSEWDAFDQSLSGEQHRFRNGINSQYDRRFGDFTPTFGLRGDLTNDFGFNPGLLTGIGWALSKTVLFKIKGGYAVNVPTFEQLYQTTHGSIDQTRGNPDLEEERVWSYDLGVEVTFAKNRMLQLTIFRSDTSDLITYERGADLIYRPTNLDSAMRQGVEFIGKYLWDTGLSSETSLTLQDSENRDTGKKLPYTPAIKLKETLSYTLTEYKTRLEGTIRYEGRRYSQMENLLAQRLDDFVVVDTKLIQPFKLSGMSTDGYLKVDNLFNTAYENHIGYPNDGIVCSAGVQIKF